jgi:hypothetical protein
MPAADSGIPLSDSQRARALLALCSVYVGSMNTPNGRALGYAQHAEKLYEKAGDKSGTALARLMVGTQQWILGRNKDAELLSRAALRIAEEAGDDVGAALAQLQVARYCVRGNLPFAGRPRAMKEAMKARERFRKLGNKWGEGKAVDLIQIEARELPRWKSMEQYISLAIDASRKELHTDDPAARKLASEYLGQIGVRNGDKRMQAEGLLGIYLNDAGPAYDRRWRRLGACLEHCQGLPGYGSLRAQEDETLKRMAPIHLPNYEKAIKAGRRTRLKFVILHWNDPSW